MSYTYLVPRDTQRIAVRSAEECLNLGLLLDRFTPREVICNDSIYNQSGRAIGKARSEWLKDQVNHFTGNKLKGLISADVRRWLARTEGADRFEMGLRGRMVIGLGHKGPMEFGITIHPVTGLPYIPGSALKGLCRSYALLTIAGLQRVNVPIETEALANLDEDLMVGKRYPIMGAKRYQLAFGSQTTAGGCIFHDAVLNSLPEKLFTLDVMTPHFSEYYTSNGKSPPTDADKPIPVNYLTVTEGTAFAFAVGKRSGFDEKDTVKQARIWLKSALQEMGIGAKTAQGYGVFAPIVQK